MQNYIDSICLPSYLIPSGNRLDHVNEFNSSNSTLWTVSNSAATQFTPVLISSGLPPDPKKFVWRAQKGLFVEMAEFLPHKLISAEYYSGDHATNLRQQHYEVSNILEWVYTMFQNSRCHHLPKGTRADSWPSGLPTTDNPLLPEFSWRWLASIWLALLTKSSCNRVE